MNIGLLIAGGSGQRMRQDIPKQFIPVFDKPIIIYTLEAFQEHPQIDAILVVCLEGWHDILVAYAKQYNITKLKWVVNGGVNGQASIRNGLLELAQHCSHDDIVLVHDGIRPNLSAEIISDCIEQCRLHGSAVTSVPCNEAMLISDDRLTSNQQISRDVLMRTQTPHVFPLGKLLWAHEEASKVGITNSVATCTLMIELGETVHFAKGSDKNIKITCAEDIALFKALISAKKDAWLK